MIYERGLINGIKKFKVKLLKVPIIVDDFFYDR